MKLFKSMVYAQTRSEYEDAEQNFFTDTVSVKYPQWINYISTLYLGRPETWSMYSRIERRLPTHGSNTTAYAEVSMKITKETVFGRMKTRNLPELLMVICDGSKYYCDRLIDIGNNRTEFLVYAKSKYIFQLK